MDQGLWGEGGPDAVLVCVCVAMWVGLLAIR